MFKLFEYISSCHPQAFFWNFIKVCWKLESDLFISEPTLYRSGKYEWRRSRRRSTHKIWVQIAFELMFVSLTTKRNAETSILSLVNSRWGVWPWMTRKRWNHSHSKNTDRPSAPARVWHCHRVLFCIYLRSISCWITMLGHYLDPDDAVDDKRIYFCGRRTIHWFMLYFEIKPFAITSYDWIHQTLVAIA